MKKIFVIAIASLMALSASAQKIGRVNFNELVMLMPEMDAARETIAASFRAALAEYARRDRRYGKVK